MQGIGILSDMTNVVEVPKALRLLGLFRRSVLFLSLALGFRFRCVAFVFGWHGGIHFSSPRDEASVQFFGFRGILLR